MQEVVRVSEWIYEKQWNKIAKLVSIPLKSSTVEVQV